METMQGHRSVPLAFPPPQPPLDPGTVIPDPLSSSSLTPWNLCLWPLEKNSSTDPLPLPVAPTLIAWRTVCSKQMMPFLSVKIQED